MPSTLRSSGSMKMPSRSAWLASCSSTFWPSSRTSPPLRALMPTSMRISSDRPEPTRPAHTEHLAVVELEGQRSSRSGCVRSRTASAGVASEGAACGPRASPAPGPSIMVMTSRSVSPTTGRVATRLPSRRTVTRSAMRKISDNRCETYSTATSRSRRLADDGEQALHLGPVEGRRRLVHDHDAEVLRQGLGDLHQLLVGHAQVLDALLGRHVQPQLAQHGRGAAVDVRPVHQATPPAGARGPGRCCRPRSAAGMRLNSWLMTLMPARWDCMRVSNCTRGRPRGASPTWADAGRRGP